MSIIPDLKLDLAVFLLKIVSGDEQKHNFPGKDA
jgi:hypothetical protein